MEISNNNEQDKINEVKEKEIYNKDLIIAAKKKEIPIKETKGLKLKKTLIFAKSI